ncbi:DUF4368 domain-containing protein [Gordonibacter massiliensis (ex Traore et al. 2017)]|uniref:DUF4368 domain-containing protein n=1 Tax=Gordonibacter massiliensis (ex Traore et al. 2017) TaxID=1841863 RepID=UPI001C8E145F
MVKYAPRKVYIRESGGYVELSYTEFCRCRESDQTYMDKLFIPIQGCLLEVVREQYTDFYRDKERWRYLQKLDTKNRLLSLDGFTDSEGNPLDFITDEAVDIAETVVNAVMVDRLKAALPLLSDSEQELIQAIFFDGLSEREVGARLGITQSVVNKRKARILMAVNDEKAVRAIEKRLTETDQSRAKALEKERKKLNKRLAELDRLFSSLYEDKVMERITERNFEMMSGKYQKEQLEIEARLKEVTETLNESYEKSRGIRDFLALIRNYQGLKELDATVINALIDKILVSEREKMADGTVKQEIKIYYKFIGFVDELHIIPTKRWAAMPAKNCTVCGVEYVPGSGASRYCPACAKKIRREKSNESKRRSREQKRIACMNCPQKMTD